MRGGDLQRCDRLGRDEEEEEPPIYAQGQKVGQSEADNIQLSGQYG